MAFSNANNATYNLQATLRGDGYVKSDVATWIKEQWATMVRREFEQDLRMRKYVKMVSFPQGKVGDKVTIPTLGRLAVNRKTAGVPVTLQKGNTGTWAIEVTQYVECSYMIEDLVKIFLDPSGLLAMNLAKEASYAMKRDMDAFILGLRAAIMNVGGSFVVYSSDNGLNTTTSTSQPLTIQSILRAKTVLEENDVPTDDLVLIVSPLQYSQILAQDKTQSMFYRTSAPLENGLVGTLYGIPVYMTSMVNANSTTGFLNGSTAIPTPGVTGSGQIYYPDQDSATTLPVTWDTTLNTTADTQAMHTAVLMGGDAFAMALMQEPKVEAGRELLYLSDVVVTSSLYGARQYRTNSAVLIHTNGTQPVVS